MFLSYETCCYVWLHRSIIFLYLVAMRAQAGAVGMEPPWVSCYCRNYGERPDLDRGQWWLTKSDGWRIKKMLIPKFDCKAYDAPPPRSTKF